MSEKEMEHMNSIYKKLKTIKFEIIIVSIALFVLGLLLVIFPTASQEIICKGIGVALCVWGVLRLINYFRIAGSEILGSYGLVQGVTLLAFGMFFVIKPGFIAVFLGTALAIIIIIDGILKLQYAVDWHHCITESIFNIISTSSIYWNCSDDRRIMGFYISYENCICYKEGW